MKKRLIIIFISILLMLPLFAQAQIQSFGTYKIDNATTPFGIDLAKGSVIFNNTTSDIFVLMKNENANATLSGLILGTDYINLQLWKGNTFSDYLNQSVLTTSWPTFHTLYLTNLNMSGNIDAQDIYPSTTNLFNIGSISNYFANIYVNHFISTAVTGTQPYATTSTTLNVNLNADLLDGHHGSYYVSTQASEYIGIHNPLTWAITPVNVAEFRIYNHINESDTTAQVGTINASADSMFVNITVPGHYEIVYSFSFTSSANDLIIFRTLISTTEILAVKEISATAAYYYSITLTATKYLTAGQQIYIQVRGENSAPTINFQYMNVFVKKL